MPATAGIHRYLVRFIIPAKAGIQVPYLVRDVRNSGRGLRHGDIS
jgi:hypothetical protein